MVPPVEKFMSKVRKLGVGDGHQIIIYDSHGLFSAARVSGYLKSWVKKTLLSLMADFLNG